MNNKAQRLLKREVTTLKEKVQHSLPPNEGGDDSQSLFETPFAILSWCTSNLERFDYNQEETFDNDLCEYMETPFNTSVSLSLRSK